MLRNASLVVTTVRWRTSSANVEAHQQPEKWDSVTRRNSESQKILDRVSLVMIDEVSHPHHLSSLHSSVS
jgi:hypothetical protein